MSYKSLLAFVNDTERSLKALDATVELARALDAHLDVVAFGLDRTQVGYFYGTVAATVIQDGYDQALASARRAEAAVRDRLGREELRWGAQGVVTQMGAMGSLVGLNARFSDLVVLPQPYGQDTRPEDAAVLEASLFEGQAAVLVLPDSAVAEGKLPQMGRAVLAWNQTPEAMQAARRALPLLKAAKSVNIVVVDPPSHGPERSDPGGPLSQWLSRHGIRGEVSVLAKSLPTVGEVLSRHIRETDADLLVMGAYSHSRLREMILGGATRDMLETAQVPVLMAH